MPYVEVDGIRLFYERTGEGVPLILHAHHHTAWMVYQVPYFSQFYEVIVFDRRGTGRSDDPPGPWTAADLAADIRRLMDGLGIARAIVGGNSLGGVVTAQFGLDYPERAFALVIGHTVPYLWPLAREWLEEQIDLALRGEPAVVYQPRSFAWEEQGPPTIRPGFPETAEGRFWATLDRALGRSPEGRVKSLQVLAGWDLRPRFPELRWLSLPTLVIVGANEPQKTIELAYEWHLQYANSEFVILPETHHAAAIENPVGWNRAVHGFLQRHGF